jgi:hypothetical protein
MTDLKSIRAHRAFQATRSALAALVLGTGALGAQSRAVQREVALLAAPGGATLATVHPGAMVSVQQRKNGLTRVVIDGFIDTSTLGGRKATYQISVKAPSGALLRAAGKADARVVAQLRTGIGLAPMTRAGQWVRVRRGGWIESSAFTAPPATAAAPPPAAPAVAAASPAPPAAPTGAAAPVPEGALTPMRSLDLRANPDGATLGAVRPGTIMMPLARERGWIRVRVEGWVPERDILPADTALSRSITAADLRADPVGSKGRIVRWEVEVIAFQTADPLRKELAQDEPYLLARGPGKENALLYLAIPPSLVAQAKLIPPLATALVTARVRTGRSDPVGVPILDIQSITRR